MKLLFVSIALACAALLPMSQAQAVNFDLTVRGSVESGEDGSGLFFSLGTFFTGQPSILKFRGYSSGTLSEGNFFVGTAQIQSMSVTIAGVTIVRNFAGGSFAAIYNEIGGDGTDRNLTLSGQSPDLTGGVGISLSFNDPAFPLNFETPFSLNVSSLPSSILQSEFVLRNEDINSTLPNTIGFLSLSDISLTTGVPEPASWAVMIVGFGMIGTVMRRRERMHVTFA